MYNSTNNELVRTKTLVKGTVITIDAAPFRQWYEAHYALPLARKKNQKLSEEDNAIINKKRCVARSSRMIVLTSKRIRQHFVLFNLRSASCQAKYTERQKSAAVDPLLLEQFATGRLLG